MADIPESTKTDAIDILTTYVDFIRNEVRADDFERHPYVPHIEQTIEDLRAAPPAMDREAVEKVRALVAEIDAGKLDELDAVADKWSAEAGVQRMSNAICSVFEGYASQDVMDRFREKVAALMHLSFVEGAAQGVLQLKPAIAHDQTLRSIVAKHTRIGGYPDTDAIARDAYNLALSTLSADAIRQGEGATTARYSVVGSDLWRHVKRGTVYEVIGTAELQAGQPQLEHAELVIYRGEDGKLWARNSGEFHDGRFVPATPASHASDGGKA